MVWMKASGSSPQKDILRYPEKSVNSKKSKDIFYGYFRISFVGYRHGYQGILSLDIKGYLLYSHIYSAISFYIQQVIHRYPTVYPVFILFILIYPAFYPVFIL